MKFQVKFSACKVPAAEAVEFRLLSYGPQATVDGQAFDFTPADAAAALAAFKARGLEGVLADYEHQSIAHLAGFEAFKSPDGKAPAAGWFGMEARADGLWATAVKWTESAAKLIKEGAYKYFSPVLVWRYGQEFGRVAGIHSIGLTNEPRLTNISALAARCDLGELLSAYSGKESTMPFSAEVVGALGVKADATDQQVLEAITGLKNKAAEAATLTPFKALAETGAVKITALEGEVVTLKADRLKIEGELTACKATLETAHKTLSETVLLYAKETGRIAPAAEAGFKAIADKDPVAALTAFKATPAGSAVPVGRIGSGADAGGGQGAENAGPGKTDDLLTACKGTAGFNAERLKLHNDAIAYQAGHPGTDYTTAVAAVSRKA